MRPLLFGKYCLLERISVGGMAEVFRARPFGAPGATDRYLALKRILPHLAEDDEFLTMFVDEAKLCVHLRHPNVVRVYELGSFQSSPYILMEFISGQDLLALQKRLRQRRLIMSVAQACHVISKLARGLHHAHFATDDSGAPLRIIHRDISPQNVLISYTGQVKLIDFGVAKTTVQETKTQVGVLKGKFGYMSPEQIRGEVIDHRSDVFSAGIVFWELLTNRRLFTGENEFDIFEKVRDARVEPPSSKNPQIPEAVDAIAMRALTRDPGDRYPTAEAFADALDAFLETITPRYEASHLADWMERFFTDELASERQKNEDFAGLQTPDDVRRLIFGTEQPAEANDGDEDAAEATRLWDANVEPAEGEDIDRFVANHTVVQAGGFDLEEFMALRDDELIEVHDDEPPESSPDATNEEIQIFTGAEPSMGNWDLRGAGGTAQVRSAVAGSVSPTETLNRDILLTPGFEMPSDGFSNVTMAGGPALTDQQLVAQRERLAQAKRRRDVRAGLAVVSVVTCLALMAFTAYLAMNRGGGEEVAPAPAPEPVAPAAPGKIVVMTTPASGVEVLLDGEPIGEASPAVADEVPAGAHEVTVRADGYAPQTRAVEVGSGQLVPVDVVLEAE
jgi:serine/threonine protein kinase